MDKNYIARSIEETRKEFEETIARHSALMEAWKSVERRTRMNGSDYSLLSNNFKNAKLVPNGCFNYPDLKVSCFVPGSYEYETDSIHTIHFVESDEDTTGRQLFKSYGVKPYYEMTVSDIFAEIDKRIEYHAGIVSEYEKALEHLEETFTRFADSVCSAIDEVKTNKTIYYACIDWMHKQF